MEALLEQQFKLGKRIEQLVANYKTTAVERRTRKYLKSRIEKLESIWDDFYSNHVELEAFKDHGTASNYWKNEYFENISALSENFKATLLEAIGAITPTVHKTSMENRDELSMLSNTAFPSQLAKSEQAQLEAMFKKQEMAMKTVVHYLEDIENKATERHTKAYYEMKIKLLQENWSEINKTNHIIWSLATPENLTDHGYDEDKVRELDDWLQDTIIALQDKLNGLDVGGAPNTGFRTSVELPKINLPVFSGNYLKWLQFKELYVELIHNQPISKAQKMCYLTSHLSGEPKTLIQHLSTTDKNYASAWDILTKRYDNERILVNSVLDRLILQSPIQHETAYAVKMLHDTTNECLLGLKNLGVDIDTWDPILLNILIKKLDKSTHNLYEQSLKAPRELQTISGFLAFLEQRFQALEALGKDKRNACQNNPNKQTGNTPRSSLLASAKETKCVICKGNHLLFSCKEFLNLSPMDRYQAVRKSKLCINCLKAGHSILQCPSGNCLKCSKKHNTLLHRETTQPQSEVKVQQPIEELRTNKAQHGNSSRNQDVVTLTAGASSRYRSQVLLSTAVLQIADKGGEFKNVRAILDCGSEINIITERTVRRLGLKGSDSTVSIQGIGHTTQTSPRRINIQLRSRINGFHTRLEAFTLAQITPPRPACSVDISNWSLPKNLPLADPHFNEPSTIDLLLGAEIYYQLLCIGQISLGYKLPTLQNTVLGWVVSGRVESTASTSAICGICTTEEEKLNEHMEQFWKLEECDTYSSKLSAQEIKCETYFKQTTKRDSEGRFIVKLPFADEADKLGESKDIAMRRFLYLERKLAKNPELQSQYVDFMQEYIRLNHMEEVKLDEITLGSHYFLPHHCVLKPESTTTKLRVVFDASCKTSTNVSLNDMLCKGPTIQDDIFAILVRFRMPRYVFTADIEKMYRQIWVDESDRKYQLVIWRQHPSDGLKYYQLNTVTYGTKSAPYLATKCLQQLAFQNETQYSLGALQLRQNLYMDDAMCGSDKLGDAVEMQTQLRKILESAGFYLRKWCSNNPRVLQGIAEKDWAVQLDLPDGSEEHIKTLGLAWLPKKDEFIVKTSHTPHHKVTKRTALSDIAHLYDPLGLMGPVTITAKIFIQNLWKLKMDWDTVLPMEMHSTWLAFREGLQELNTIRIPRHVCSGKLPKDLQLHAFADASEKAYGAAIYVRAIHTDGTITVHLLCSKSRVAPLKTVTLPRLELCAAKLAVDLVHRLKRDLKMIDKVCFFWTDSEIVLCWINSQSSCYHTFVANRIAAIQDKSSPSQWRHVSSKDNPADLVSRGVAPAKLKHCNLWFFGPMFLHGEERIWPAAFVKKQVELERKQSKTVLVSMDQPPHFIYRIQHRHSYETLQRVTAYIVRFINNCREKVKSKRSTNYLMVSELEEALFILIKEAQMQGFPEDLKELRRSHQVHQTSSLISLAPFLDHRGIIRVGGRLEESSLSYDAKHPMLLPYSHFITKLLLTHLHKTNLHPGPQTLLSITRQRFWPVKGKTIARSVVQNCIRCARLKPKLLTQQMGNLPAQRVQAARPFANAGVDFCGPFYVHFKIRGKRPQKAYVAVFCCFATKATHLEVVSDLTTEAFIGALKRFVGRRGSCRTLWCDNATNFVGTKNQLTELKDIIYSPQAQQKVNKICTRKGMDFRFIPPRAPHFGGLWEAAVKSAKHLLQRHAANASLTYEELETAIIEVEAVMNSRPLTPLSADPNDLTALTPGHFLIGEPLNSNLESQPHNNKVNLGQRWKIISEIKERFWQRWSFEYLNELQQRNKWRQQCHNIKPGMMVVIKDENLPVMKWQLGRIVEGIKGNDGLIRVVDVRTANGILRRPIHKLAPLPIELEETDQTWLTAEDEPSKELEEHSIQDSTEDSTNTVQKRQIHNSVTHHKRARYSSSSIATVLLLIGLIIPVFGHSKVNITSFQSPPGLYFERMGDADFILNEWNLVAYYDLSMYWKEFYTIKDGINQLGEICMKIKLNTSCSPTVNQFNYRLQEIQNNNKFLIQSDMNPLLQHRRKRGALNIVGNMANALFGVLDTEYANEMSATIDSLKNNDAKLLELIKNQTSIINATVNIMKGDRESIEQQLKEFQVFANQTTEEIKGLHKIFIEHRLAQTFNLLALQMILIMDNYQRVQTAILNVIIDMHHGKINPQLIPPNQLKEELTNIKEHLPSSLRLPGRTNNIMEIYSLMTVEGRCLTNQMIFRLKLPLLTYERFQLLHIVPVPMIMDETVNIITPTSKYLIIDLHRDQYYPLTDQELSTCKISNDLNYMCKQHHPLYRRGSNVSECELSFLSHSSLQHKCEMSRISNPARWIQLLNPNQWIYFWPREGAVNIICGSDMSQFTLEGSGILTLASGCVIKADTSTIQAHKLYPSTFKTSFIPTRNISEILIDVKEVETIHIPKVTTLNHSEQIEALQRQLTKLTSSQTLDLELQGHEIHQFAIGYVAVLLIVIIIIYLIGRKWVNSCPLRKINKPIPKPRISTSLPSIPATKSRRKTKDDTATTPDFKLDINPNDHLI